MGYRSDIHICIEKKNFSKIMHMPFLDYCDVDELEDDLLHIHAKSLKLYMDDEWDNLCSEVKELDDYHIIQIGEDGAVDEEYGDEPLFDWSVEVHLPSSELGKFDLESNFTYTTLVDFLSLALPNEYRVSPQRFGMGIIDNVSHLVVMNIYPAEDNKVYLRLNTNPRVIDDKNPIMDLINQRFNTTKDKRPDGFTGYIVDSVSPTKLSWENENEWRKRT